MTELKPGTLVIMNDTDEPSARLIAVVEEFDKDDGIYCCQYLSTYPHMKKPYGPDPTPVTKFGVKVVFGNGHFAAFQIEPSHATYKKDGKNRPWQQYNKSPIQKYRKRAADIYWKSKTQNTNASKKSIKRVGK